MTCETGKSIVYQNQVTAKVEIVHVQPISHQGCTHTVAKAHYNVA